MRQVLKKKEKTFTQQALTQENSTVSINGDITTGENDTAIYASNGSTVNVTGEVNGGRISVWDGAQVTTGGGAVSQVFVSDDNSALSGIMDVEAEGDTAVYAWGSVTVSIENDVSAVGTISIVTLPDGSTQTAYMGGRAVHAGNNAVVTIGGDVSVDGDYSVAIDAFDKASVPNFGEIKNYSINMKTAWDSIQANDIPKVYISTEFETLEDVKEYLMYIYGEVDEELAQARFEESKDEWHTEHNNFIGCSVYCSSIYA